MSKDLNQCNFIGRMGKDPVSNTMPNGDNVTNFSIACGDDYKSKDGQKVEKTNWINIVAFRRLGEIISQYCHKGSKVFISGKMQTRKYQANDGTDRYVTEVIANDIQMLDSKPSSENNQTQHQYQASQQAHQPAQNKQPVQNNAEDPFMDDIPF